MTAAQIIAIALFAVVLVGAMASQFVIGFADGGAAAGLKRVALVLAVAYGAVVVTVAVGGPFWMAANA